MRFYIRNHILKYVVRRHYFLDMWVQDFTVLFVAIAPQVWPTMSVLNMLMKVSTAQPPSESSCSASDIAQCTLVGTVDDYIGNLKNDIDSGRLDLHGRHLIVSSDVEGMVRNVHADLQARRREHLTEAAALSLAMRPDVFVWAPHKTFPSLRVQCPSCNAAITSQEWTEKRILHGLGAHLLYITVKYRCRACPCPAGMQDVGPAAAKKCCENTKSDSVRLRRDAL
jgi:hypothetical protein